MELIKKGAMQYKANLHCHSNKSDGKLSPERLKEIYKDHGYSILSITDHEYPYDHSALSDEDFLMLTGYEAYIRPSENCVYDIYQEEIHINLFAKEPHNTAYVNFTDLYCKYVKDEDVRRSFRKVGSSEPRKYTVQYINSFVEAARENGYLCAYNHPTWSLERDEQIVKYRGFFSMEMCNWGAHVASENEYNARLYDRLLREGVRIYCHSADDNHNYHPIDSPKSDSFGGFAMVMAKDLSYPSVIEALESGNFYSSMGPEIKELTVDGAKVHMECSPARKIIMHYGSKKTQYFASFEDDLTSADFTIPEDAPYVRFTVIDKNGRAADTRGYFMDEILA